MALGLYSCLGLGHLFIRFGGRESKACWEVGRMKKGPKAYNKMGGQLRPLPSLTALVVVVAS